MVKDSPYTHLAKYYDRLINQDYPEWTNYLIQLWRDFGKRPTDILEIGCGTGNITLSLAQAGYSMWGIDVSEQMLAEASRKANQIGMDPIFSAQSVTEFELQQTFDVCIAPCDGLNYLTSEKSLAEAFSRVYQHVRPHGLFLFDLNSAYKLQEIYGDNVYAEVYPDFGYFWENRYHTKQAICEMDLTFFTPAGNGLYKRVDEVHKQKLWSPQTVYHLLAEAGWEVVGYFGFLTKEEPSEDCERWQFVAQKGESTP